MKQTWILSAISLLGMGCQEDTSNTEPTIDITNVDVSSAPCDGEAIPADEVSISTMDDQVTVTHSNFEESSCLGFTVSGDLDDDTLTLTYTETGEACDCISTYALTYEIVGLSSGTYTVEFPGDVSQELTIE